MSAESLKKGIQVEWKDIAPCSRRAEYIVSKELVDQEFAEALKEASKQAQLPGFRKGKAPIALVKSRYGEMIVEDVAKHIHNLAFEKTSEDKAIDIVSIDPSEAPAMPKQGEEYRFSFTFDVAPEIKMPDYKGLKLDAAKTESLDERLAKRLEYLKNLYADYKTIEEPAKAGDMLKVSYSSDFALPEGASASLQRLVKAEEGWIWLSEPEQIPGSVKALEGVKKGDERSFASVFPADYKEAALVGKTVNYKVKVLEMQRRVPVENDAQLAEKLHATDIAKMHEDLKKAVEGELAQERKAGVKDKALETILTLTPDFQFPKSIFNSYTEREFTKIAEQTVKSEADVEKFKQEKEKHLEEARNAATKQLKKFFILRKIADAENIKVEQHEIDSQIQGMSTYYGYKERDVRKALDRNGGMGEMHADILMSKVLDLVAEKAQINAAV